MPADVGADCPGRIQATDDIGVVTETTLTIGPLTVRHFSTHDLEQGGVRGLGPGIGPGTGYRQITNVSR